MKHIFVINPNAGKENVAEKLKNDLKAFEDLDIEAYETTGERDATRYVQEYCQAHPEEKVRFYACGGDGTLNEVASGAAGQTQASITCYASGSGNDFVKYYGGKERFLNLEKLLRTEDERPIDLFKVNDRWCINVFNFGFDSCVGDTMIKVKRKPIIGGKRAYVTGVVNALLTAMKTDCKIMIDGETVNDKKILLATVANANYVGGSFRCAPRAKTDDGLIDICIIDTISRFRFIKLLGTYTKGEHLDDPKFSDVIHYYQGKKVTVDFRTKNPLACLDGEMLYGPHYEVEMYPGHIRFAVPEE